MDEEEDDFYDPVDSVSTTQVANDGANAASDQPQESDEMEEEEVEVESDDDDFNIITEAPADAPPQEASHPRHASLRQEPQRPSSADSSAVSKSGTPSATPRLDASTPVTAPAAAATKPTAPQKPGSAYPAIHTSTIDVNGNPVHPTTGKPIMATDMDVDFPTDDKPWRRPGSDVSDFFNYGFDEFTWVSYCLKQQGTRKDVVDQKRQMDDMQSFLGMGMPPMPGAPQDQLQRPTPRRPCPGMLQAMMAQGIDPSSMDPMAFMQHAQAMMGGQPGGGAPQAQPGFGGQAQGPGFGQGGQGQMGYGGYEQRGNYGGGGRGRGRRW
ncbi:hypothetical protein N7509_011307 [Penicillium cosmopolitanum]|uniref:Pre-mRNA polyadenylation factor Fip1 domain-containing protein n=1 Tax=Penicillium cosmopolitanum TaxID=1131564 RepID=A0A9W9VSU8_9EURO|nr:uncharacterized protein N7509_011307 [Penicillium cosmopolitanum]KAJ5388766.1 hypothetical protein N7509_011307 [Penicillium cosmopolitanum]